MDDLLGYYNNELHFLRQMGDEFARAHPRVAGNLKMGAAGEGDPFVGRMLEAFAYLSARIRRKLDDDFPEICASLLEILYPHYLRPVPAMAIAQFELDRSLADRSEGEVVPAGATLEYQLDGGQSCPFRTCYPVTCLPLAIVSAGLEGSTINAPHVRLAGSKAAAQSTLHIQLNGFSEATPLQQLAPSSTDQPDGERRQLRLRCYINASPPDCYDLYELLLNHVLEVAAAPDGRRDRPVLLSPQAVSPVGFEADEGLFDYPPQSFLGYRLLSEFFAFPQKFLFFDVDVTEAIRHCATSRLDLFFYLDTRREELEPRVRKDTFRLGCTPIINLYECIAEPLVVDHSQVEYRVIPERHNLAAHEVYSIDRVVGVMDGGEPVDIRPFYSFKHGDDADRKQVFWHPTRRVSPDADSLGYRATDTFVTFVDLDFHPPSATRWDVEVRTTCFNRNLPSLIRTGTRPKIQMQTGDPILTVQCLTTPTRVASAPRMENLRWRLVSHLCLNHLSLVDRADGAAALREILTLYDYHSTDQSKRMIRGLLHVSRRQKVARAGGANGGLCRGLEVTLQFDAEKFDGGGLFLFASILDRFLGLYTSTNSFTQTVARTANKEIRRWPPRAGTMQLL